MTGARFRVKKRSRKKIRYGAAEKPYIKVQDEVYAETVTLSHLDRITWEKTRNC
jgi:hypothetical protein